MKYIVLSVLLLFISCSQQSKIEGEVNIMDQTVIDNLKSIEKFKIYFGHQSVGFNIMDGVADLIKEAGNENINILGTDGKQDLPEYYFVHSKVGKNTEPNSKCDAFSEILSGDFAKNLDVTFLKFCFVDMQAEDDPKSVFEYYQSTMDSLNKKYPKLSIVHVTIPLTTIQTGWKVILKNLLGKKVGGYPENVKRLEFNEMLKKYYKDDPIFDLAAVESTYPDGSRECFEQDGSTYYALAPDYTYDGGHLNELGRKLAAKELIRILAETIKKKNDYQQ